MADNAAQVSLLNETDETIKDWKTKVTQPAINLRRKVGTAKTMDDIADLVVEARGKNISMASVILWASSWPKKQG